jgi:hypothetical protein
MMTPHPPMAASMLLAKLKAVERRFFDTIEQHDNKCNLLEGVLVLAVSNIMQHNNI